MFLDCANKNNCEIFVVEGRDAGNALRQLRDRRTQAVLAMQGKVPNAARRVNQKKIFVNPQISALLQATQLTAKGMRFSRILLLSDADADGLHSRALLTLFFAMHFPSLLEQGGLYVVHPPLYKINSVSLGDKCFVWNREQLQNRLNKLESIGCPDVQVTHYKGLASMRAGELLDTCVSANSRAVSAVTPGDGAAVLSSFSAAAG